MTHDEFYQASPIKRRRRTNDQVEQLERQILEVLEHDHPQSVRHVFYRMTDPRLPEPVEKTDNGYAQVQTRILKLRESGALPYSWICDLSRRGYFVSTFDGPSDFLRQTAGLYRADLWAQSSYYCEVWCESRSLASVIQDDCEELAVSLFPSGGFASATLAYQAAEAINLRMRDAKKDVKIFYIGDHDAAGVLIDVDIERKLRQHLHPDIEMEFTRLAINPDQIRDYDLPTKPRKEKERRARHVEHAVEAESLPAGIMRRIVRSAVEELLPEDALAVAKAAEDSERSYFMQLADALGRRA